MRMSLRWLTVPNELLHNDLRLGGRIQSVAHRPLWRRPAWNFSIQALPLTTCQCWQVSLGRLQKRVSNQVRTENTDFTSLFQPQPGLFLVCFSLPIQPDCDDFIGCQMQQDLSRQEKCILNPLNLSQDQMVLRSLTYLLEMSW